MAKSEASTKKVPQIITSDKTLSEIKDITRQLSLKNLYSLLGCARGLLRAQNTK